MSSADHLATGAPAPVALARTPVATSVLAWGGAVALAWGVVATAASLLPNKVVGFAEPLYVTETHRGLAAWAILLAIAAVAGSIWAPLGTRLRRTAPWLLVLAAFVGLWDTLTAKLGVLPVPFFAPPSSLVEVYADDWPRLTESILHSLRLLSLGFAFGAVAGFVTGVSIGWSRGLGYWVHPVLRFLGPIPSTALLPMAFFFFPSSFSAAIFLIALATWFPVTVLTWSGVASVDRAYYDVARTLGARERFLIFKVAIPAALPHVFVGLFMGLGASFSVLVAAEMMGVKSGLGYYLQWAQGWAAYSNMYGALIVMALIFSGLITLLFAVRDRLLGWQKDVVKW